MEPLLGTLAELRASVEPRLASMGGDTDNTGLPLGFLSTPWAVGLISLQKTRRSQNGRELAQQPTRLLLLSLCEGSEVRSCIPGCRNPGAE